MVKQRQRANPKKIPCWAQNPTQGLISSPWDQDQSRNQESGIQPTVEYCIICCIIFSIFYCHLWREERKIRREDKKDRAFFPPMFFSVCLVSKAVSILDPLHPTGHRAQGVSHSIPRFYQHACWYLLPLSSCLGGAEETLAPSSNKRVEMDGSHISQLQLAARFGEITFPGTNWEPVLEIKGTAH